MRSPLFIVGALLMTGCARNALPPISTTNEDINRNVINTYYKVAQVESKMPQSAPSEFPCGHQTTVKVGKLEVEMPQGSSFEIAGVKGSTSSYHVVLEGVEFINSDHCLR